MYTQEIYDFILKARLKVISIGRHIVESDGDSPLLPLGLELLDFLETLHTNDGTISDDDILKTVHYLSQKAELNLLPLIDLPTYEQYLISGEGTSQVNLELVSHFNHGLMSKEDKIKLDGLTGGALFLSDIPVSLSNGKTLGRFVTGEVIPATGKTIEEVMLMIAQEPINPTLTVTLSKTEAEYREQNIAINVNYATIVRTLGGTLVSIKIEKSRDNAVWTVLKDTVNPTLSGSIQDTVNAAGIDNRIVYYRVTAVDSANGSTVVTKTISFKTYVAPTMSIGAGTLNRELGDIKSTVVLNVTRNTPLVPLIYANLQYNVNGTGWVTMGGANSVIAAGGGTVSLVHEDNSFRQANTIAYRYAVTDDQGTIYSSALTVNLMSPKYLGYSAELSLDGAGVILLDLRGASNSKAYEQSGITAAAGQYTYYFYHAAAGDLTGVIMDGAAPVLGAFSKQGDVTFTNRFGATVTLRGYRSNAVKAFTNNTLKFS